MISTPNKMTRQYPEIYIPTSIEKIGGRPLFRSEYPKEPQFSPAYTMLTILALSPIIGFILKSWFIFLVMVLVAFGLGINRLLTICKKNEKYQKQIDELAKFREAEKTWEKRNTVALQATCPPDGQKESPKKGFSEDAFFEYLQRYTILEHKIYQGCYLKNPEHDHGFEYTVDIAYINNCIHIDIEIDEPYNHFDKKPIHYLEYENEEKRNKFFQNNGWFVIRFAEEQVINFPNECANEILKLISNFDQDMFIFYFLFRNSKLPESKDWTSPILPKIKRWTIDEAKQMAIENYRQSYLNNPHYLIEGFLY